MVTERKVTVVGLIINAARQLNSELENAMPLRNEWTLHHSG
jgi:hypothetical protein